MSRVAIALTLCVFAAVPLLASDARKAERLPDDPDRLPRLIEQIKAAKLEARDRAGAQVITESRTARTIVFPSAGSVHGGGGEFFRSEVTLDSPTNNQLEVFWLGRGATGTPPAFLVDPHDKYGYALTYRDFVGDTLGLHEALGALWIIPVDSAGKLDPKGIVEGFSRIWTNQPGQTKGTVSQQFQAVDPFSFQWYWKAIAFGLQHNADYRTSWGIVNLDSKPHTYNIFPTSLLHNTENNTKVTIPPFGMVQTAISRDIDFGPNGMFVVIRLEDDFATTPPPFVAFASSTDNVTGDGWVVLSSADWSNDDFPTGTGNPAIDH